MQLSPPEETVHSGKFRELVSPLGVQRSEDARNLASLRARRRSPGDLEQPLRKSAPQNFRSPVLWTAERWTLAEKIAEACDVARAAKSF